MPITIAPAAQPAIKRAVARHNLEVALQRVRGRQAFKEATRRPLWTKGFGHALRTAHNAARKAACLEKGERYVRV